MLRIRYKRRNLVVLASVALGTVAHAAPPQAAPRPPVLLAPIGTVEYHASAASLRIRWRQDAAASGQAEPAYFQICVFDKQTCGLSWMEAAINIPRTVIQRFPPFGPIAGYNYTFSVAGLPAKYRDRALTWTVGACETQATSSCTFPTTVSTWLSTRNLIAEEIVLEYSDTPGIVTLATVHNSGSTASTGFNTLFEGRLAFYDTWSDSCVSSVNFPTVTDDDIALTDRGERIRLGDLPVVGGQRDAGGRRVVAIYPENEPGRNAFTDSGPGPQSLNAGAARTLEANDSWWQLDMPPVVAVRYEVDTDDTVVEFDETDNAMGACFFIR